MSVIAFEVKQKILTLGRSEGLQKLLWQINNYSVKIRYWTFPMGKNSIFRLENRFSSARRECTVHSEGRANIGFWSGFQIVLLKYSYIFYTFINVCVIKKNLKKNHFIYVFFWEKHSFLLLTLIFSQFSWIVLFHVVFSMVRRFCDSISLSLFVSNLVQIIYHVPISVNFRK